MNKTVLITGASGGLGRALAFAFAEKKYNLILNGRSNDLLERLCKEIVLNPAYNTGCNIISGDICKESTISQIAAMAEDRDLDILINNAAMYINREFVCTAPSVFRKVIETNLIAPILLTHRLFPVFQRKQSGIVININSLAGKIGSEGEVAYCASKHGLSGFSKAIQFDATRYNIRVLNIYLGAMKTDMSKGRIGWNNFMSPLDTASMLVAMCEDYPSLRITEVEIGRRNY